MRFSHVALLSSLVAVLALVGAAPAETKVELKGVHICCGQCVKIATNAVKDIEGVKVACDQKAKTVTITAADANAAQKAVDTLAAAGFHGESSDKDVTIKEDSGASKGKVKSVTVTGIHNCCPQCCRAIKATVKKVDGVTGDTAKPKENSFEVTGDFDAAELVKALNDAGFHVKVTK